MKLTQEQIEKELAKELAEINDDDVKTTEGGGDNGKTPGVEGAEGGEPATQTTEGAKEGEGAKPEEGTKPEGEEPPADDMEAYRKKLNELAAAKFGDNQDAEPSATSEPAPVPEPPPVQYADQEFFTDESDLMTPGTFNTALNKAVKDAIKHSSVDEKKIVNNVLKTVGGAVSRMVNDMVTANMAVHTFFLDNKDLAPYKDYVRFKVTEMRSKNPEVKLNELLTKAAEEVRKDLQMVQKKNVKSQPLPKTSSIARPSTEDSRTQLQKELDEL